MSPTAGEFVYLGRNRVERLRANLVQTLWTASALVEIGVDAELWLPHGRGPISAADRCRELGLRAQPRLHASRLLKTRLGFEVFIRLHRARLRGAARVYVRAVEFSLALMRAGIRHDLEVHDVRALRQEDALSTVAAAHRDGILSRIFPISHRGAEALIDAGCDAARVVVAPSGVDCESFAQVPDYVPRAAAPLRLLHAGKLTEDRGASIYDAVLAAGGCQLLIAGRAERIPQGARHCGVVEHRQIPSLYADADAVLLPYQPELDIAETISPIKLFEAMAAGRPIVASDLPTLREILEHERTALFVAPGDVSAWLQAIDRLRCEPDLGRAMAAAARVEARRFDWRNRARTIADGRAVFNPRS